MADYTAQQLNDGVLITDGLVGETNFNFTFPASMSGSAYFTFETLANNTASYSGIVGLAKGIKSVVGTSKIQVKPVGTNGNTDDFIWSAIVMDGNTVGNNVITWTPTTNVGVGTALLRGTGGISLNTSPSIYPFTTKAELQTAVNLWISDNTSALATYGEINTWNTTAITNMGDLFSNKTTFNSDISNWDVSNVTNMSNMFTFAESFNQPLNNWDMRNVTIMGYMFQYADAFQQPLNLWQLNSLTGTLGVGFMGNTGAAGAITYNLLDTLYNGWAANEGNLESNVTISFGNSTFTAAGLAAKNILVNTKNWTITDGGQV